MSILQSRQQNHDLKIYYDISTKFFVGRKLSILQSRQQTHGLKIYYDISTNFFAGRKLSIRATFPFWHSDDHFESDRFSLNYKTSQIHLLVWGSDLFNSLPTIWIKTRVLHEFNKNKIQFRRFSDEWYFSFWLWWVKSYPMNRYNTLTSFELTYLMLFQDHEKN